MEGKTMRAGETKYKGEIMTQLSKIRWNKQGHNQLAFKDIALVLDEAKTDLAKIIKKHMFSASMSGATNYGQYYVDAYREWIEKWIGEIQP